MITQPPAASRNLKTDELTCDLAVIGGGLAGACCAITAARAGLKVTLVQDRPVLGGNASSEVRLWILGATSHMGNNNRWAREGGLIDEIMVENLYRNPEGNALILDTILLEKAVSEPNLTLLLNTAVHDLEKNPDDSIRSVRAFCPQNSTSYHIHARLFADASGDGIVGFLSGAAFRIGAESKAEFGEAYAPETAHNELLGHTLYFYSRDTGRPVRFMPPSYALQDITEIPRWRDFKAGDSGCRLWWLEWGGQHDTIHDSESIKWELWKVAYGVWNHIKNSGQFPEAETLTLEWVGTIPGKRESRRFEGDLMLTQQDIVEQRSHPDAVSYGGWAIDLHPVEGVYSPEPGCTQWHSKGVYQIPYRCFYSRNIPNLFLAGRIISASHIAFGSTRVMATCGHGGQAVGLAAALCCKHKLNPRELHEKGHIPELQRALLRTGHFLPEVPLSDPRDLAASATLSASSELKLHTLAPSGETLPLNDSWAMMLPFNPGDVPRLTLILDVAAATTFRVEFRISSKLGNHTPDFTIKTLDLPLKPGRNQSIALDFDLTLDVPLYGFVCLLKNEDLSVHLSDQRLTGVLSLVHAANKAVAKSAVQTPPAGSGIDTFEFWTPKRRPDGKNLALTIEPPLEAFSVGNLVNGYDRPTGHPNAWVADFDHEQPVVRLRWNEPQTIRTIELGFDSDFDHPMESVLMGHPERVMPFCVQSVRVNAHAPVTVAAKGGAEERATSRQEPVAEITGNHHSLRVLRFDPPLVTDHLELHPVAPSSTVPAALLAVRCYAE